MNHPETTRTAGAATPNGPWPASVEKNSNQTQRIRNACSDTSLDDRLDEMIAIADATGATLDAVVAQLGRAPEDAWRFFVDTLAAIVGGEV